MLRSIGLPEVSIILAILFGLLLLLAVRVVPYWKIFSKAGYSGALGLLMVIPFVELVVLYVIAFSDWPAFRRLPPGPAGIPQ